MKKIQLLISLFFFITISIFAKKPADTLPVELVYFNGNAEGNTIQLFWGTATETNNFGYNVERSVDSLNWEVIGFVVGHGNSPSPKDYSFNDTTLVESNTYFYRLMQIDNDGKFEYTDAITVSIVITSVEEDKLIIPFEFSLEQNYPNPFNPTTKIEYSIPKVETGHAPSLQQNISIIIYDVNGREVAVLVNKVQLAGKYSVNFNAGNLSSGIYFYTLSIGNKTLTKKMNLIK